MSSIVLVGAKLSIFDFRFFHDLPGWTSMVLLIMMILSIQLIFLGILGEYIARIFDEVRNRPYYIIENVYEHNEPDQ
jgi:glycosyltransferase involved in cell wall biosynthesis